MEHDPRQGGTIRGLMPRIMDEVPGVVGMKQSPGDLKFISDLVAETSKDNLVLTAASALLCPAFALAVDGAISALTTAVPGVCVSLWNAIPHDLLPACVKYAQHRQGLRLYPPRAPMRPLDAGRNEAIDAALRLLSV